MEALKKSDPVEVWIEEFVESVQPEFDGKSQKERTTAALQAYYAAQGNEEAPLMAPKNANIKPRIHIIKTVAGEGRPGSVALTGHGNVKEEITMKEDLNIKRAYAITKLALHEDIDDVLIKAYVEHSYDPAVTFPSSIQIISDSFEDFKKSVTLTESNTVKVGDDGSVKCVEKFGACKVGDVYKGTWKQAAFSHQLRLDIDRALPGATRHPDIFLDKNTGKVSISKQFELQ